MEDLKLDHAKLKIIAFLFQVFDNTCEYFQNVVFDLELGFSTVDEKTSAVFSDFTFIKTSDQDMGGNINRDMVIIASEIEHKVAIVDILSGSSVLTVVSLRYETFMTAQRNRRQVEWVIGTPYIWIDGTSDRELYVLNTDTK